MLHTQKRQCTFFAFFTIALASQITDVCFSQTLGELRLEGQYIERLDLRRKDGQTEQFNRPEETIRLPVGEYRIQDVRLKNGLIYNRRNSSTYHWVSVTEDKPVMLKVGAPLKQTVTIKRQGPILVFHYKLTGVGGENYTATRSKHPTFTVFKGEKPVATGEFEFG